MSERRATEMGQDFQQLVLAIRRAHHDLQSAAVQAVNTALTLRNWLIGRQIHHYEQQGADRARYGSHLLESLAARLRTELDRAYTGRYLGLCRQFHCIYPDIGKSLISDSTVFPANWKSLISETSATEGADRAEAPEIDGAVVPASVLLRGLSFTHFIELIKCAAPLQRRFYEIEALRSVWSVRELKRQMSSLYFERSGLSTDKAALRRLADSAAERQAPTLVVRDPYVFEFLGLRPAEVIREADLETALLDKLQGFLLELGHGFCFEARQKRVLMGAEHFFVDLVFYHRVLKCHILIELKTDSFRHEHLGQLNSYVAWYREHQMTPGDQPPIGILLCTAKNDDLVHYALAGLNNTLFVSRYQVELPRREDMAMFLAQALKELGHGD